MASRRENEQRKAALLAFFRENPDATGDEAQEALKSGKLTGKRGPAIGLGVLYELRKQAREGVPAPLASPLPPADPVRLQHLRELASQLQRELDGAGDIVSVTITRDGTTVRRVADTAL